MGEEGVVCGVDLSAGMLRLAGPAASVFHGLRICGAAEALPVREGAWDAVVCLGVFPHFADRSVALREIRRALRPGGLVAILHLMGRERLNATHQKIGGSAAEDLLPDEAEVSRALEENGFRVMEVADTPEWYRAVAQRAV